MTSYCLSASGIRSNDQPVLFSALFYLSIKSPVGGFAILIWCFLTVNIHASTIPVEVIRVKLYHVDSFSVSIALRTGVQYQRVSIDHLYLVPKQSIRLNKAARTERFPVSAAKFSSGKQGDLCRRNVNAHQTGRFPLYNDVKFIAPAGIQKAKSRGCTLLARVYIKEGTYS